MKNKFYLPGLDGLRAISIIAILIFHMNSKWLRGGYLGVDTFFIISGFLITTLLVRECETNGSINLKQFWWKRIKRLFPAVYFLMFCVLVYSLFFEKELIDTLNKDMIAAVFYVSNWWYIFEKIDYFQSFNIRPLKHLWSLSIEEQYYLLYPLLLTFLFKKRVTKVQLCYIFLFMALWSAALMAFLYVPGENITRLYFGTDTRLQSLLLGSFLGVAWPVYRLKQHPPKVAVILIDILGFLSLGILIYAMIYMAQSHPIVFNGGFLLLGLATLMIIVSVTFPKTIMSRLVGNQLFTLIGKYSYSIYLWHYPVITFIGHHFVQGQAPMWAYGLMIIMTITCSYISYNLIEVPFRKMNFKHLSRRPWKYTSIILVSMIIIASTIYMDYENIGKQVHETHATHTVKTTQIPTRLPKIDRKDETNTSYSTLFIGDSVLVDINDVIQQKFKNAVVDGQVGRNIYKAIPLAKTYSQYNHKDAIVVLEVGTNGDFSKTHMDTLLNTFNKANVFLVTTRVPLDYESHVNTIMRDAANKRDNVYLIDWYSHSQNHTEYFALDGIHLEYPGVTALSDLIYNEVKKEFPDFP